MSGGGGTPPLHSRFRKGQSGNPNGRPRKQAPARQKSAFDIVLDKTLTVTHDGVPRDLTVEEALQWKTYQSALSGSRLAQRQILKMIEKQEQARDNRPGKKPTANVRIMTECKSPRTADEALRILGVITADTDRPNPPGSPERMLIEAWAVQTALSRRHGVEKLSSEEVRRVRTATRDADSIRWPRGHDR
ncbi:DUF5681 domain-containing protein [Tepidamorphus sp. 3E244]|uniref:DUF5681 domain-containing protein n=1 Tax=Tepidamorphus sp. 3E244 TaxID=3385498 RepID=UPI0038FCAFCA